MPPQDSVRLNNSGQTEQGWPEARHPYQQGPFTIPQPEMLRCPLQSDVELMTKKEVLNFKPVPRLEQVGDIRSKQVDNHKHRIGWCADSALVRESGRIEFSGITGVPAMSAMSSRPNSRNRPSNFHAGCIDIGQRSPLTV